MCCYLRMKRARSKFILDPRVMCVGYLKAKQTRVLKSRECVSSSMDARDACRGKVPRQTDKRSTSMFWLKKYEFKLRPGSKSHEFQTLGQLEE